MRWDSLFDDLETQLERELTAEEIDLEAEEERLRLGRLTVRDRLAGIHRSGVGGAGSRVGIVLSNGVRLVVHPVTVGRDWFSADIVDDSARKAQCIVPLGAIAGVSIDPVDLATSMTTAGEGDGPALTARLGLTFVLRDLCRRRRALDLVLSGGDLHGTIDRVGRDHLDLAVHERGDARRESAVREVRLVPLAALLFVRL